MPCIIDILLIVQLVTCGVEQIFDSKLDSVSSLIKNHISNFLLELSPQAFDSVKLGLILDVLDQLDVELLGFIEDLLGSVDTCVVPEDGNFLVLALLTNELDELRGILTIIIIGLSEVDKLTILKANGSHDDGSFASIL